jgi:hypothetical protein
MGLCLIGDNQAALCIGWLDFAYFVQHRKDFINAHHNRFMASFASGKSQSADYKVLHDGTIVEFDPQQLRKDERQIFDHASKIPHSNYERTSVKSLPMPPRFGSR